MLIFIAYFNSKPVAVKMTICCNDGSIGIRLILHAVLYASLIILLIVCYHLLNMNNSPGVIAG